MSGIHALMAFIAIVAGGAEPQILYFRSTWCEPCKLMEPAIERLDRAGYSIEQVDLDQQPDVAEKLGITAAPVFVIVENGKPVDGIRGFTTYDKLLALLQKHQIPPDVTMRGQTPRGIGQLPSSILGAITPRSFEKSSPEPRKSNSVSDSRGPRPELQEVSPQSRSTIAELALAGTVRLQIEDPKGHSFGSGTIIHAHDQEALVATCAHIFRDSQGKGTIVADRIVDGRVETTNGTLIGLNEKHDVALVGITLKSPVTPILLATSASSITPGTEVFSVGCNHGESPTVAAGKINDVNKYLGGANYTASPRPIDGRSGGGLFDLEGNLLGICNAADPELDEGLYAALPRLTQLLDQHQLSFVYRSIPPSAPQSALASAPASRSPQSALADSPTRNPTASPSSASRLPASRSPVSTFASEGRVAPASFASPDNSLDRGRNSSWIPQVPEANRPASLGNRETGSQELVCIVRDQQGERQVFVIPQPTQELLEQLRHASTAPAGGGIR